MFCGEYFHKETPERNKKSYKFHDYPRIFLDGDHSGSYRKFPVENCWPRKVPNWKRCFFFPLFFPMKIREKSPKSPIFFLMIVDKKRRWMYSRSSEEKRFIRKEAGSPQPYCWRKKIRLASWYGKYHSIYKVSYIPGWCRISSINGSFSLVLFQLAMWAWVDKRVWIVPRWSGRLERPLS